MFYILFYGIYKYISKNRIVLIFIITVIGSCLFFAFGWAQGWYSSGFAFPLGLLYGECFDKCQKILNSWYGKIVMFLLCVAGLSSLLLSGDSILGMVYLRNIMCIGALMLIVCVCNRFTAVNGVTKFLEKYSTELYLSQFVFLNIVSAFGWEYKISLIAVILSTVIMSIVLHPIVKFVRHRTKG